MTWFKVDDSFHDHPKVFDAPDCAVALWTRAGTWAARNLTNGFVPSGMPARLCDDPDTAVKELVRRGLWKRASGGYQFHDWADFQPTADSVRSLRAKRAEAGRLGGQAKAAKQNAGNVLASASAVAKQNAAPTRPVPKGRGGTGDLLGEGSVTREAQEPRPPAQCIDHKDDPDPPACRKCRTAREAAEAWDAAYAVSHAMATARVRDTRPQCPKHRGQLAHNCAPCRADRLADPADCPPLDPPSTEETA